MLLWELIAAPTIREIQSDGQCPFVVPVAKRLPYDRRCCVVTKTGKRCRGRIRKDSEYCPLHDPETARRRELAAARPVRRNPLSHLPDGYLRKLTKRAAVGNALDRLYREVRLGIISPEMGAVLFGILTRLLDSGQLDGGRLVDAAKSRCKADRLRPKMKDLLTRAEMASWKKAVANAPASVIAHHTGRPGAHEPLTLPLQAAS